MFEHVCLPKDCKIENFIITMLESICNHKNPIIHL